MYTPRDIVNERTICKDCRSINSVVGVKQLLEVTELGDAEDVCVEGHLSIMCSNCGSKDIMLLKITRDKGKYVNNE